MAHDIFLKINGIEGESQDANYEKAIDVQGWRWGMDQASNMHIGGGGGAGKATVHDLTFSHEIDRASPNLMKYCLTGKHIDQAVLIMRKAGGDKKVEYLKITMTDVIITVVIPVASSMEASETVSLSFATVKQEYMAQAEKGGSAGAVTAGYNIKTGKEM